jgi:hypothetical protein
MRRCYLLLLAVLLAAPLLPAQTAAAPKVKIHGTAEDTDGKPVKGVKLEFQLRGDPQKQAVETGPDGNFAIDVVPGMYEILAHMPDPKVPPFDGTAWLSQDTVFNVRVPDAPKDKEKTQSVI